eukprot:2282499-Pyramimonas_sp.AAC.1
MSTRPLFHMVCRASGWRKLAAPSGAGSQRIGSVGRTINFRAIDARRSDSECKCLLWGSVRVQTVLSMTRLRN